MIGAWHPTSTRRKSHAICHVVQLTCKLLYGTVQSCRAAHLMHLVQSQKLPLGNSQLHTSSVLLAAIKCLLPQLGHCSIALRPFSPRGSHSTPGSCPRSMSMIAHSFCFFTSYRFSTHLLCHTTPQTYRLLNEQRLFSDRTIHVDSPTHLYGSTHPPPHVHLKRVNRPRNNQKRKNPDTRRTPSTTKETSKTYLHGGRLTQLHTSPKIHLYHKLSELSSSSRT